MCEKKLCFQGQACDEGPACEGVLCVIDAVQPPWLLMRTRGKMRSRLTERPSLVERLVSFSLLSCMPNILIHS